MAVISRHVQCSAELPCGGERDRWSYLDVRGVRVCRIDDQRVPTEHCEILIGGGPGRES